MRLPEGKGKPKLPPPPKGGGAAAREQQSEMERGHVESGVADDEAQAIKQKSRQKKKKK
jgi:hypothetical protein